jgi:hypothetical protein
MVHPAAAGRRLGHLQAALGRHRHISSSLASPPALPLPLLLPIDIFEGDTEVSASTVGSSSAAPLLSAETVGALELGAEDPQLVSKAAALFREHGCVVIRGLNNRWVGAINEAVRRTVDQSRRLEQLGSIERVPEGWVTPDGTLFIPAAWDGTVAEKNRHKPVMDLVAQLGDAQNVEKQIMVPAVD